MLESSCSKDPRAPTENNLYFTIMRSVINSVGSSQATLYIYSCLIPKYHNLIAILHLIYRLFIQEVNVRYRLTRRDRRLICQPQNFDLAKFKKGVTSSLKGHYRLCSIALKIFIVAIIPRMSYPMNCEKVYVASLILNSSKF